MTIIRSDDSPIPPAPPVDEPLPPRLPGDRRPKRNPPPADVTIDTPPMTMAEMVAKIATDSSVAPRLLAEHGLSGIVFDDPAKGAEIDAMFDAALAGEVPEPEPEIPEKSKEERLVEQGYEALFNYFLELLQPVKPTERDPYEGNKEGLASAEEARKLFTGLGSGKMVSKAFINAMRTNGNQRLALRPVGMRFFNPDPLIE